MRFAKIAVSKSQSAFLGLRIKQILFPFPSFFIVTHTQQIGIMVPLSHLIHLFVEILQVLGK